ncbi:MAG: hypothetical protein ACQERF_07250 [Actinomycetota bacterium]
MKFSTRELATLAVFGALWGLVEITLGAVIKTLNIPLSSLILVSIGLAVALVGRVYVPRRGSTLFIGVIAMLLKLFSVGGVVLGPMVAILFEALIAELVLSSMGRPRRTSFVVAGAAGVAWLLVHPFLTGLLFFGRSLFVVWQDLLDLGNRVLGLDPSAAVWIVLALAIIHLAIGAVVGWVSWDLARTLKKRTGR